MDSNEPTQRIDLHWVDRYQDRVQDYRLPKSKTERVRHADTIGADGCALLVAATAPTAPSDVRTLDTVNLLYRV